MENCLWCSEGFTVTGVMCRQCHGFGKKTAYVGTVVQSMYEDPERLACQVVCGYVLDCLEVQMLDGLTELYNTVNLDRVYNVAPMLTPLTTTVNVKHMNIPGRNEYYNKVVNRLTKLGKTNELPQLMQGLK